MATLYVTEFRNFAGVETRFTNVAPMPPLVEQTVAIGGSSTQSSAFSASTNIVRLHTDSICSVEFGSNPTATVTTARLAANTTEYFAVLPGQKVAVITNT